MFSGVFSPEGYSKYYDRMRAADKGTLPEGEQVYGYEQAVEHAKEIKKKDKFAADTQFLIEVQTIVSTIIPVL